MSQPLAIRTDILIYGCIILKVLPAELLTPLGRCQRFSRKPRVALTKILVRDVGINLLILTFLYTFTTMLGGVCS